MSDERNKGGRPLSFTNPDDMQALVDLYFKTDAWVSLDGNPEHKIYRPTVTGLAMFLGMTRITLINYGKDERFSNTVEAAKSRIERHLEAHLYGNATSGIQFNLQNNFRWKNRSETDITSSDGSMSPAEPALTQEQGLAILNAICGGDSSAAAALDALDDDGAGDS